MIPIYKAGIYTCAVCKTQETVALDESESLPGGGEISMASAITWCVNSHVVIHQHGFSPRHIATFGKNV